MAEFTVNPTRHDPYKNSKFRVVWDGRVVAGISRVSALGRESDVASHREGGDPNISRRAPGLTHYDPIVLQRGRTHDPDFENWANMVWSLGVAPETKLADFRKDIVIQLLNEAGQIVMAFNVFRCWPSQYIALGALDSDEDSTVIESLTLQHEGWVRDTSVVEPKEPA